MCFYYTVIVPGSITYTWMNRTKAMVSRRALSYGWFGWGTPQFEWQKLPIHLLMRIIKLCFTLHDHICLKPILHSFPVTLVSTGIISILQAFFLYIFFDFHLSIWYWGKILVILSVYNSMTALYTMLSGSAVTYFGSKWSDFKSSKQGLANFFSFQNLHWNCWSTATRHNITLAVLRGMQSMFGAKFVYSLHTLTCFRGHIFCYNIAALCIRL